MLVLTLLLQVQCAANTDRLLPPLLKFSAEQEFVFPGLGNNASWTCREARGVLPGARRGPLVEVWVLRQFIEPIEADSLLAASNTSEGKLFNSDPDSVDGDPTEEIPLLRNGKPVLGRTDLVPLQWEGMAVWEKVNQYVQRKLQCKLCVVCTSLLRRYGTGSSRSAIKFHFDEYAFATAIVSLDEPTNYVGGLVVQSEPLAHLRRLVLLHKGDLVIHSYDLLHSVDVQAGARRSLIMWISSSPNACRTAATPWKLKDARRGNAHAQYQLAKSWIFKHSAKLRQRGWGWLQRAAQKGHARAQLHWGLRQMELGHDQDARRWWLRAAKKDVMEAAHNLGVSLMGPVEGPSLNAARGMYWLRRAAAQGDADSKRLLGGCVIRHTPCLA